MATKKLTNIRATAEHPINSRWDMQWLWQYDNLLKFRKKKPNKWPSLTDQHPTGNRLGQWAQRQRDLHEARLLAKERVAMLNKISFPWEKTDGRDVHWTTQYGHLVDYRKKNPKKWPFAREEFPKGNRLGLWVWRQRQNFATDMISKERIQLLKKIGFPLELPDRWETHFSTLKDYRKKNPNRWPKAREEFPAGNRLGLWCHLQRCAYKADKLSRERLKALEGLGFQWSVKSMSWDRNYQLLKEYKKSAPKKWPVIDSSTPENRKLITWSSIQRNKRKNKKLEKEKIAALDKIGFRW